MATVGESIENPLSGERVTWIETAASSRGDVLAFDLEMQPGAAVAAEHRHLRQEERFAVTSGTINVSIDGAERTLATGENAVVPSGVAHRWSNGATERAVVRVELRPALESEVFFETLFGLARDGRTSAKGIPGLLQIAVAYAELGDSCSRVVKPPVAIQKLVLAPLAPLGRWLGRRASYPAYSPDRVDGS
ncbi:MAG TPA: cupin domain-containing protein [Solirubrobacteraceae bacterium]|jgi:quercetin dioxygenase-like cupin family protein|nr:cupin domain-containing protein [Solirubrobacteraceae bacterium]